MFVLVIIGDYLLGDFLKYSWTIFVLKNKNKIASQAENIWRKERKEKKKWVLN